MITDVPGVRVGHWTDAEAQTGCTVVLFPAGTVASGEVRGGAPASRELALLAPERLVAHVSAVVLTGGSAFGLAAADGVMRFCEERGMGVPTPAGPVPIVPTMAVFDLAVGDPAVRPGPDEGHAAALAASDGAIELGPVGAGTGATVGKWLGGEPARTGLASSTRRAGDLVVSALVALNGVGDPDPDGGGAQRAADVLAEAQVEPAQPFGNTTIGVIATNARLDKSGCLLMAQSAHDGLARSMAPGHTRFDGDGFVAAATGAVDAELDVVRILATAAVESAIRSLA